MKLWVAITDDGWFDYLRSREPDEVNFWQPSGNKTFKVLQPGEPFLFKLHSPKNYIVGGGFFVRYTTLPYSLAWEAFGDKNGVRNQDEFFARIQRYRRKSKKIEHNPDIGCNILSHPFFFPEKDWVPVPADWAANIVQGKSYDTAGKVGASLWEQVKSKLYPIDGLQLNEVNEIDQNKRPEYFVKGRLGQGAFRILVTDAYQRRCAVTGERTLPALEAAHIKPYSNLGPNLVENGLLLRSDLHKLFDIGYLTVTPELHIEVSPKIKQEYENGREYYAYHGRRLSSVPQANQDQPSRQFLEWHNQNIYIS